MTAALTVTVIVVVYALFVGALARVFGRIRDRYEAVNAKLERMNAVLDDFFDGDETVGRRR